MSGFTVGIILVVAFAALLGWVPGAIAARRGHPNASAILVCGIVGALLVGIFWLVALVWAFTGQPQEFEPRPRRLKRNHVVTRSPHRRRTREGRRRDAAADALSQL